MIPYGQLRTDIETALKKKLQTPKDFEFLRERIYARLHILVSRTTLMRLWGYVDEDVKPRKATLDILSHFLGYEDWDAYCQNSRLPKALHTYTRATYSTQGVAKVKRLSLPWVVPEYYLNKVGVERRNSKFTTECYIIYHVCRSFISNWKYSNCCIILFSNSFLLSELSSYYRYGRSGQQC